ncbi:cytochrome c biogenesis protein CcsA [Psychrosphaera haliotis]|nr:cytochrome c biogenesis protein CcsA [Psychrosphaera haliotis]
MTFIELGLITCFIGFLASSVLCAKSIYSKSATNSKAILLVSVLSTAIQLVIARQALYIDNQIHLSLASMSLLIAGLINLAVVVRSIKQLNPMMIIVTTGFSALLSLLLLATPLSSALYTGGVTASSIALVVHIALSVGAYCILVMASLYAIQFHYIDSKLKAKTLSLNSFLPPLNIVERQHFNLMALGLVLLTAALLTGFMFLDTMLSKEYAHKTALSLIAWGIFLILTIGHKVYGWRGTNSAFATVIAAVILSLAYFGSRFVKEILLN